MSSLVHILSTWVWYAIFTSLSAITIGILILKYSENVRRKFFSVVYRMSTPSFYNYLIPQKKLLFSALANTKSADPKLRQQGLFRVLEVGVGPGHNFPFYPANLQLIILEPNTYFEEERKENLVKCPGITIARTVIGYGENMADIEDNTMDVVVGTFLLCSVRNRDDVLKEIQRVLVPGGTYYFMEHSCGPRSPFHWKIQNFINPIWKILFDGCQINKNAVKGIKNCGLFENVEPIVIPVPSPVNKVLAFLMSQCAYGTAQKPVSHIN